MDIKFAHVLTALEKLRDEVGSSDNAKKAKLEIYVTEDDPGAGKIVSCLTMKCTVAIPPYRHDTFTSETTQEVTVEMFSESENRAPRITVTKTRDLSRVSDGNEV